MEETKHLAAGSSHPALVPDSQRIYAMRFCPFAQRALLVAEAKGVKYDVVYINLEKKPDWFLALNPKGTVPTLEFEDGNMLTESLIVCDFLNDKYPARPLYSHDALLKAKDRLLIERFGEAGGLTFKLQMGIANTEVDIKCFQQLKLVLEKYEAEIHSRGTFFFGGDQPGMLDYMIWPWFERQSILTASSGDILDVFNEGFPNLVHWVAAMKEDAVVQKWLLPTEAHVTFTRCMVAGDNEYDFVIKK